MTVNSSTYSRDGSPASRLFARVSSIGIFCWNKRTPLLLIGGLLVLSFIAMPRYIVPTHAAGYPGGPGTVCLMDPSTAPAPPANPCPATPYTFTGPFPSTPQIAPTQIMIGVFVNGSNALNSFDITVKSSNTSVLIPVAFNTTGSLLPGILVACVNGILAAGPHCDATDTYGTIHVSMYSQTIKSPPVTGLLFTTIWKIVGNSLASGVGVGFQTGCTGTSVGPDVCVTVSNGSLTPVPETIQTGSTFSNPSPLTVPWIALTSTPNASNLSVPKGTVVSVAVSAIAENGWPGLFSTDLISFSLKTTPPTGTGPLSVTSCSTGGTSCGTSFTLPTGSYRAYLVGEYATVDPSTGFSGSLIASIQFNVNAADFAVSASPNYFTGTPSVLTTVGNVGNSTITVNAVNGFTGTVSLSATPSVSGPTISLSRPYVTLNSTVTSDSVNLQVSDNKAESFNVTVSGRIVSLTHSVTVSVTVGTAAPDVIINCNPTSLTLVVGTSGASRCTLASANNFGGVVNIIAFDDFRTLLVNNTIIPQVAQASLTLSPGGTRSVTFSVTTLSSTFPFVYPILVLVSTNTASRSFVLETVVNPVGGPNLPDYTVGLNATSLIIAHGNTKSLGITLTPLNGFAALINLGATGGPGISFVGGTTLPGVGTFLRLPTAPYTATLTVSTASTTPLGVYIVTIQFNGGTSTPVVQHTVLVAIIVT